jgi:hypothetical protein
MDVAQEKRNFMFPTREANPPVEHRVANALEHIAHYLERIDGHLEQLAKTVAENGNGFPVLRDQIAGVREAIEVAGRRAGAGPLKLP